MKTMILAAFLLTCEYAGAQAKKETVPSSGRSSLYCMVQRGDDLVLMKDGKQIYTDVKLDDGTRITANGRILKTDGTERLLKENECADLDGEILTPVRKTD